MLAGRRAIRPARQGLIDAHVHLREPANVGTAEQARREVRREHAVGYDLIKIHGEMEERAFTAAIAEATRPGMRVVGHRPDNLPIATVLASGLAALADPRPRSSA